MCSLPTLAKLLLQNTNPKAKQAIRQSVLASEIFAEGIRAGDVSLETLPHSGTILHVQNRIGPR